MTHLNETVSNFEAYVFRELCYFLGRDYDLIPSYKGFECLDIGDDRDFDFNREIDILCTKGNGYYVGVEVQSFGHFTEDVIKKDEAKFVDCRNFGLPLLYYIDSKVNSRLGFSAKKKYKENGMMLYYSIHKLGEKIKDMLDNPSNYPEMRRIADDKTIEYQNIKLNRISARKKSFDKEKNLQQRYLWALKDAGFPSDDEIEVRQNLDSKPLNQIVPMDMEDIKEMVQEVLKRLKQ